MSLMTPAAAVSRIRNALPSSPISVFRAADAVGMVDCVFARTIKTQREIILNSANYIGTYSCVDHPDIVRTSLAVHCGGM